MLNNSIWQILGALVIGLIILQLMVFLVDSVKRSLHRFKRLKIEADLLNEELGILQDLRKKKANQPLGWGGWRKFVVKEKHMEVGNICSFILKPHDGKSIPSFQPGQYLTFNLDIPGQAKPVIRCYSLSNRPDQSHYRVSIKRVRQPPDKPQLPPGLGSCFFHDNIQEGDIIDVKSPGGHFFFNSDANRPVVLIGGGIGLTPVLSMILALAENRDKREIWLFYGVCNSSDHALRTEIDNCVAHSDNINLVLCYSKPGKADVSIPHHPGRITLDLLKEKLPSNNYDFYICGPGPLMKSMISGLELWGVPKTHVFFETFGPSSVKNIAKPQTPTLTSNVTFKKSEKTIPWDGKCANLLELAEMNDIEIPFGCRAGNCGTCAVAIKKGNVSYSQEPGSKPEKGTCLTCVAIPSEDLSIDA